MIVKILVEVNVVPYGDVELPGDDTIRDHVRQAVVDAIHADDKRGMWGSHPVGDYASLDVPVVKVVNHSGEVW